MDKIIDDLIKQKILKTPAIIEAFKRVSREDFLPEEVRRAAAENNALPIGFGQTNSQPLTVAFMMELLEPGPGERILDVGSGSGWTAALLSAIVGREGRVYGLEIIPELKDMAEANVSRYDFISRGITQIFLGDGYLGLPELAPFDKIMVAAAAAGPPEALKKQLAIGGRMVLPLGRPDQSQDLVVIEKTGEDDFKDKRYPGFIFVPLVKS